MVNLNGSNGRDKWSILVHAWVVLAVGVTSLMAYPPLTKEIVAEFQISYAAAGLLVTGSMLTGSLAQFAIGPLVDRFGGRRLLVAVLGVMTLGTILSGVSRDYVQLLLSRVIVGTGAAMFPICSKVIAEWFSRERMGLAQGFLGGAFAAGIGIASLVMPYASLSLGGWRASFGALGLILLPFVLISWVKVRDPESFSRPIDARASFVFGIGSSQSWLLGLANFALFGTLVCVAAWSPTYFATVWNLPLTSAGLLSAVGFGIGIGSRPFGGMLSDRYSKVRLLLLSLAVIGASSLCIALSFNVAVAFSLAILLGFFANFGQGVVFAIPPLWFGEKAGTVIGLVAALGMAAATALPLVFGFLIDTTGIFDTGFVMLTTVSLIVGLACNRLREPQREFG